MKKGFILTLVIGLCLTLSAQVYSSGFVSHNPEPVITDFTNATHDHADAAGGGTISVATAGAITDQGGGSNLEIKIIEIGDWNMDVDQNRLITHGLTGANIISVTGHIRDDSNVNRYAITQGRPAGPVSPDVAIYKWDAGNIEAVRLTGGSFDNVNFDATGYSRGKLFVIYSI